MVVVHPDGKGSGRPTTVGGTNPPPLLHSPHLWLQTQYPTRQTGMVPTSDQLRGQFAQAETARAFAAQSDASKEHQFLRLADMYRVWAPYADLDDMLGAGLSMFPHIPRPYARALAMSLKRWIPERRDIAVTTDHPPKVDAATDTVPRDNGAVDSTTPPRPYRPPVENITPPSLPLNRREGDLTLLELDPVPDTSGLYPAPPGFDDYEPMELGNIPIEELPLEGNGPGNQWPDLPHAGNDLPAPPDDNVTDTEFCRCLEAIARQL